MGSMQHNGILNFCLPHTTASFPHGFPEACFFRCDEPIKTALPVSTASSRPDVPSYIGVRSCCTNYPHSRKAGPATQIGSSPLQQFVHYDTIWERAASAP